MMQTRKPKPVGLRPGAMDLMVIRGDDYKVRLEFYDANDDPLDITGWSLGAEMRDTYQGALLATFTIETIGLPDNELNLVLVPGQTELLGEGVYPWDLQRFAGGSVVRTLISGVAVVSPDVTEAP